MVPTIAFVASRFIPGGTMVFLRSSTNSSGKIPPIPKNASTAIMKLVSDQREKACSTVSRPGGASGGAGFTRSSTRAIRCVSQYTSAPIWSTGTRR